MIMAGHDLPRILVVATVHWASLTRLCLALCDAGVAVTLLALAGHALHGYPGLRTRRLPRGHRAALGLLMQEVAAWRPSMIVPGDEGAIALLTSAARRPALAALVHRSIGPPESFPIAASKKDLLALAKSLGLLVPRTQPVEGPAHLQRLAADARQPFVLKLDSGSGGGLGVRIVREPNQALSAFRSLRALVGWQAALKGSLRRFDPHPLVVRAKGRPSITLQDYIEGEPANRAVFCQDGKVMAGLSVAAIETINATGPATVVRVIDHAGMSEAAARLVARLRLSGFVGFDFVIERSTGRAFLIELNLRPTQICHLAQDAASDMIGALARGLGLADPAAPIPNFSGTTVALFPQELWRDPGSRHFATAYHDVPWSAPRIVRAYRAPVAPEQPDWLARLRRVLSRPSAPITTEAIDV